MKNNKTTILNNKARAAEQSTAIMDEGLRVYMLKVYNYMASGVLLTGIFSVLFFNLSGGYGIQVTSAGISGLSSIGYAIYASPLKWLVMLAPLGIVIYMSFGINRMSALILLIPKLI